MFAWAEVLFLATTLSAATKTLVDDRFDDALPAKLTALEADWQLVAADGTLKVEDVEKRPGGQPDKVLIFRPGNAGRVFVGTFDGRKGNSAGGGSGVVLGARPGDQLVLGFDFRFMALPASDTRLGIGLFSNAGTPGEKGHPATYADDLGYRTTLNAWGGHGTIQKVASQGAAISDAGYPVTLGGMLGKPSPPLSNGWHSFKLTLRREAEGVTVAAALDGAVFNTGVDSKASDAFDDPPGLITSFHEIIVSLAGRAPNGLLLDNVRLHSFAEPYAWHISLAGVVKAAGLVGAIAILVGVVAAVCYRLVKWWRA